MDLITWAILVAYAVGWFVMLPHTYRVLDSGPLAASRDDLDSWLTAALAVMVSLFWPIVLVIAWVRREAADDRDRRP